jgi:hypothetical protein
MPVKQAFSFPLSILVQEADYIIDACHKYAAQINPRSPEDFVAATNSTLDQIRDTASLQKAKTATIGGLTLTQEQAVAALNELMSQAKESAKRAFKGQDVKLRSEFQVGVNAPADLASVLLRARIIHDSCALEANAPALVTKGWQASETTALFNAIEGLDAADDSQETAKAERTTTTDQRNTFANELYDALLTIQNAANIQWPKSAAGNAAIRAEFRLSLFPPRAEKKKPTPTPTPTPTP